MINIPKGTKDVLPDESAKWQYLEARARETARLFGYREIRTPVFEHTELFLRGVGGTTDIVNKEMYTFLDKGGRSVTLKPEGTAGAVRCFIEKGLYNAPMPLGTYYFTPVFRYENPQSGRLREHHQFGVEVFGSASPRTDAEIILLADTYFRSLGIEGLTVHLNSIGCPDCRPAYQQALREFYAGHLEELCPTCRERLDKNPMRILDCKEPGCAALNRGAPRTLDFLCGACRDHFAALQELLTEAGIPFEVDTGIVRGLDYYTKTVFEFVSEFLGAKSTVCGGGRYDNLVESLGGKPTPAAGFGLGMERLILTLENMGLPLPDPEPVRIYLLPIGAETVEPAFAMCNRLRRAGIPARTDCMDRSVKAQFKYADKLGVPFVGVLGGEELQKQAVRLKNMATSEEKEVAWAELPALLKA